MRIDTPSVVIFAYNRPTNLLYLLDSLVECENSENFEYCIYIDGPKLNENPKNILEVRTIAEKFKDRMGESKVAVVARSTNIGLAQSVIQGVSEVLQTKRMVIILEDDLIVSRNSLNYFSKGLEIYKNEARVGAICGYVPFKLNTHESTFFLNEASSWGWATWSDRWREVNWDAESLYESIVISNRVYEFDSLGTYPFTEMLSLQRDKKIDSWAIRWQANLFLDNKLCLYPRKSLVSNLGFRGVGTHATRDKRYEVEVCQNFDVNFQPIMIQENAEARLALSDFYTSLTSNSGSKILFIRILVRIKKLLKKLLNVFR